MVWKAQSSTGYWGDQDPIQAPVSYRVLGDDASTPIGIAVQDQMGSLIASFCQGQRQNVRLGGIEQWRKRLDTPLGTVDYIYNQGHETVYVTPGGGGGLDSEVMYDLILCVAIWGGVTNSGGPVENIKVELNGTQIGMIGGPQPASGKLPNLYIFSFGKDKSTTSQILSCHSLADKNNPAQLLNPIVPPLGAPKKLPGNFGDVQPPSQLYLDAYAHIGYVQPGGVGDQSTFDFYNQWQWPTGSGNGTGHDGNPDLIPVTTPIIKCDPALLNDTGWKAANQGNGSTNKVKFTPPTDISSSGYQGRAWVECYCRDPSTLRLVQMSWNKIASPGGQILVNDTPLYFGANLINDYVFNPKWTELDFDLSAKRSPYCDPSNDPNYASWCNGTPNNAGNQNPTIIPGDL